MVTSTRYVDRKLGLRLRDAIDREVPFLKALTEDDVAKRPGGPESWSRKEELGHLIDSAANNHMRFVRGALDAVYEGPGYAQNAWVELHGYQVRPWEELVNFWFQYNGLLAILVGRIPRESFDAPCTIGGSAPVPLGFVIEDYVLHMQHHLDHILARDVITRYPSQAK